MQRRPPVEPVCANCGVAIRWTPVMHEGLSFCCGGCAQGGPCYCSYDAAGARSGLPPYVQDRQPGDLRHRQRQRGGPRLVAVSLGAVSIPSVESERIDQ